MTILKLDKYSPNIIRMMLPITFPFILGNTLKINPASSMDKNVPTPETKETTRLFIKLILTFLTP
jgi:hypothetical protein